MDESLKSRIHDNLVAGRAAQFLFLRALIHTPSQNPLGDTAAVVALTAKTLKSLGFGVERHNVPDGLVRERGLAAITNLVVRHEFASGPVVALNAHGDTGPAGSVTGHNCRVIHGSAINHSDAGRPLLLNVYSSADAFTYTANPLPSRHEGEIVRGRPARMAHIDPRPCILSPDWSAGYTSLFALQQEEEWGEEQLGEVSRQFGAARGASAP